MHRWQYQPSAGKCENFIYGGCGGNANNFESMKACDSKCMGRERFRDEDNRVDNRMSSWRGLFMSSDRSVCPSLVLMAKIYNYINNSYAINDAHQWRY